MAKIRIRNPNLNRNLSGELESEFFDLIGKEATVMNRRSESEGRNGDGSRSKANRRSLKFVSQVVKEKETAVVKRREHRRGRTAKR